jgi:hypothetical protein
MTVRYRQNSSEAGEVVTSPARSVRLSSCSSRISVLHSLIAKHHPLACSLAAALGFALPVIPARAEPATPYRAMIDAPTEASAGSPSVSGSSGVPKGGAAAAQPAVDSSIRPFQFHATDEQLNDLRRRIRGGSPARGAF